MKKRSVSTTTTTMTILLVGLFIFLIIYQIKLSSISSSSLADSRTGPGKQVEQRERDLIKEVQVSSQAIKCDRTHNRYDICFLNGSTVLDPLISTLFLVDLTVSKPPQMLKVRPYPRKWENDIMSMIKEITLTKAPPNTHCEVHHNAPALVISTGGYTGNVFHDFTDGFVPLFVTIRSIYPNQNPVLVIANCRNWWLTRYAELIRQFTPFPIINLDTEKTTHCFTSATIGFISHGYMAIDPKLIPHSDTFLTFRSLLGNAYIHNNYHISQSLKPRLVLVSRTGDVGRVIRNQAEVMKVAEQTGFEVVLFEPTPYTSMSDAYGLVNSSHAMLGVHGAALTHFLFLRPGSVFVQVVPIGIDWLAETCFGNPARHMGIEYIEYKIRVQESSLVEKYGIDHLVLRDPKAVVNKEFANTKNIYLKGQDVILDLDRVGKYLRKTYTKAKKFMAKEG